MKIVIFDAIRRKDVTTGYGRMSKHFGTRLANRGYEIYYFDEGKYPEKVDMWLWIRPPHYVKYPEFNPNNFNVFFTMCEQEELKAHKAEWPELLNKCDALITPSTWNRKVWQKNGVTIPIHVCPLGVDPKMFKGAKTYEFSILSVFEALGGGAREDWRANIEAYYEMFAGEHHEEVSYTIKSWTVNWDKYNAFLKDMVAIRNYDPTKLPTINVIERELMNVDLNKLYAKHWLFLKNTTGEGWSLPTLEALSAGLKIAATPLPAMEFLNSQNCTFFNGYDQLKQAIDIHWQYYKMKKNEIYSYSWKECTRILDDKLKEILHGKEA